MSSAWAASKIGRNFGASRYSPLVWEFTIRPLSFSVLAARSISLPPPRDPPALWPRGLQGASDGRARPANASFDSAARRVASDDLNTCTPGEVSERTCMSIPIASMCAMRAAPMSRSRSSSGLLAGVCARIDSPIFAKPGSTSLPASTSCHSAMISGVTKASSTAIRRKVIFTLPTPSRTKHRIHFTCNRQPDPRSMRGVREE